MENKPDLGVLELMFGGDNIRLKDLNEEASRYVEGIQPTEYGPVPINKCFMVDPAQ